MVLLVAVEERVSGVVRDKIGFHGCSCFHNYHILVHATERCAAHGDQFEIVAMQMDRVIVRAAIVKDKTMAQARRRV